MFSINRVHAFSSSWDQGCIFLGARRRRRAHQHQHGHVRRDHHVNWSHLYDYDSYAKQWPGYPTIMEEKDESYHEFKSLRPDSMELPLSVPEEEKADFFDNDTVTSPVAFRLTMRMAQPAKSPDDMLIEINELKRLLYSATTEERRAAIRTSIDALERALEPVGRMDDEVWQEADGGPPVLRRSSSISRPMSAHRSSLRTIPEDKPLNRALLLPTISIQSVQEEEEGDESILSPHPTPPSSGSAPSTTPPCSSMSAPCPTLPGTCPHTAPPTNNPPHEPKRFALMLTLPGYEIMSPQRIVEGACATSHDPAHPPENVLDERDGKWWVTTGGYPQLLVIRFKQAVQVDRVMILCHGTYDVRVSWGDSHAPLDMHHTNASNRERGDPQVFSIDTSACAVALLVLELKGATLPFSIVRHVKLFRRTR